MSDDGKGIGQIIQGCCNFSGMTARKVGNLGSGWIKLRTWRYTTAEFTKTRCGCEESFYATLEVDLSGRRLDKDGESFHLLMARHPPVEDPCPSAFAEEHTSVKDPPLSSSWRLTTDGSSSKGQGGYAVIIQPPAMPLSRSWIRR